MQTPRAGCISASAAVLRERCGRKACGWRLQRRRRGGAVSAPAIFFFSTLLFPLSRRRRRRRRRISARARVFMCTISVTRFLLFSSFLLLCNSSCYAAPSAASPRRVSDYNRRLDFRLRTTGPPIHRGTRSGCRPGRAGAAGDSSVRRCVRARGEGGPLRNTTAFKE